MVGRFEHLHSNVGTFRVVQTVVVLFAFVTLGVLTAQQGMALPLSGVGVGLVLPTVLRRSIASHSPSVALLLRYAGYVLIAAAFVLGFSDEALGTLTPLWTEVALGALCLLAVTYTTTFYWLWSDPEVRRSAAR